MHRLAEFGEKEFVVLSCPSKIIQLGNIGRQVGHYNRHIIEEMSRFRDSSAGTAPSISHLVM
jgi:hypothetical protein